jgi:hypothetical protein
MILAATVLAKRLAASATCAPSGNRIALVDGPSALRPRTRCTQSRETSSRRHLYEIQAGIPAEKHADLYGSSHCERYQHKAEVGAPLPYGVSRGKKVRAAEQIAGWTKPDAVKYPACLTQLSALTITSHLFYI